jgi:hypothetical protein
MKIIEMSLNPINREKLKLEEEEGEINFAENIFIKSSSAMKQGDHVIPRREGIGT